jgi:hypothetical protein
MPPIFSLIPYFYADEGNFGSSEIVYLAGQLSPEQTAIVASRLDGEEFFIPTEVGMVALQHRSNSFPSEMDHVWHQLDTEQFKVVTALPEGVAVLCTAAEFVERFIAAEWDVSKEYIRLGLDQTSD